MNKPKHNLETLLMREACGEFEAFASLYESWFEGQKAHPPEPEMLLRHITKYSHAYETYKLEYLKDPVVGYFENLSL